MSNRINLVRTKFTNLVGGAESFGYRIYDDCSADYSMFSDGEKPKEDDGEFLRQVADGCSSDITEMLDWALEHGIDIDGEVYEGEHVGEMLK